MTICVVEGIIGAGKSTFCQRLGQTIGANCVLMREPDEIEGNPYLDDYYKDPKKWAFTMQMHLLHERWRLYQMAKRQSEVGFTVIMDRYLWGDFAFAQTVHQLKIMSDREFETYQKCYSNIIKYVKPPEVMIYLQVNPHVAYQRVKQRMIDTPTRECEKEVDLMYLRTLEKNVTKTLDSSRIVFGSQELGYMNIAWSTQNPSDQVWDRTMTDVMELINYYRLEIKTYE